MTTSLLQNDDGYYHGDAWISDCGLYRYTLHRDWRAKGVWVGWSMLNPSTADGTQDDPTVRRCVGVAKAWNAGGIAVRNLFAWRATDPAALRSCADPVGEHNDDAILELFQVCKIVIAAWGFHGTFGGRDAHVRKLIADAGHTLHHLGLTKDGYPRHPLYLPACAQPQPWPYVPGGAS